ncbi:MAG: RNA methyltransferase [Candidatus Aminicenantaceae bacterium]
MPTKERIAKVERVLSNRQPDLHIVLEQVTNAHNASAVVRTCDAAGVLHVDLIYAADEAFPVNEAISTRAEKWLNLTHHLSTEECLLHLKQAGYTIASTHLGPESIPYTEVDYSRPMAIVFGNESAGISRAAIAAADHIIRIPMSGMAQSLNLSVSVGIILYEVLRQRRQTGFSSSLSPEEFESYKKKWLEHNHE